MLEFTENKASIFLLKEKLEFQMDENAILKIAKAFDEFSDCSNFEEIKRTRAENVLKEEKRFLKNTEAAYKENAERIVQAMKEAGIKKENARVAFVFHYNAFYPEWCFKIYDNTNEEKSTVIPANLFFTSTGGCLSMSGLISLAAGNLVLNEIKEKIAGYANFEMNQFDETSTYDEYILKYAKLLNEECKKESMEGRKVRSNTYAGILYESGSKWSTSEKTALIKNTCPDATKGEDFYYKWHFVFDMDSLISYLEKITSTSKGA